jgi:hypothetical protein
MNNSGKALTIFLVVIAILLICITGISVFFFVQEIDLRKSAEQNVEQLKGEEAKLQADILETSKKVSMMEEKNKEAETRIEELIAEVELEKGLKEELKREYRLAKDDLEKEQAAKEELQKQLAEDLKSMEEKLAQVQKELETVQSRNTELETQRQGLEGRYNDLKTKFGVSENLQAGDAGSTQAVSAQGIDKTQEQVELDPIVVNPTDGQEGEVLSVDLDTDFIIVSLGEKHGIKKDAILSIYHQGEYLGDVKVSRVLPEMSAADFLPPLTGDKIQKGDSAVIKK